MKSALLALSLLLPAPGRASISAEAEQLLDEGVTHLFNLDYEKSRESLKKLMDLEPDNPFAYLYGSGAIWWQSSQEYGLFQDTPTLQGQFEREADLALKKAELLLKTADPSAKADGHFVAGMALGTRGQWGLMRGHFMKACGDGRKAVKHLNNALKFNEGYHDAYLGLGVYDYQAAQLKGPLKLIARLCGASGNEQRGLARISQALKNGRYARRQAAQFLATIYILDLREYDKALELVRALRRDYPQSVYFHFLEIALLHRLRDVDGAVREGRALFMAQRGDMKTFGRKWLTLFCGLHGSKCLDPVNARRAGEFCAESLEAEARRPKDSKEDPAAARDWTTFLHLFRGYSWDLLKKPEEAAKDYQAVLDRPDFYDAHARAKECLASPCSSKPFQRYLRALSQDQPWPPPAPSGPAARR